MRACPGHRMDSMLASVAWCGAASIQRPGRTLWGSEGHTGGCDATTRCGVCGGHRLHRREAGSAFLVVDGTSGAHIRLYRCAVAATGPVPVVALMVTVAVLPAANAAAACDRGRNLTCKRGRGGLPPTGNAPVTAPGAAEVPLRPPPRCAGTVAGTFFGISRAANAARKERQ